VTDTDILNLKIAEVNKFIAKGQFFKPNNHTACYATVVYDVKKLKSRKTANIR